MSTIPTTPTTAKTATPATPLSDAERLQQVQRELADLRRRLSRSTLLTGIIGALLLLAVCVYFYLGYKVINDVTQPEQLVNAAQTYVDDHLPAARAKVEKWIISSAPSMASGLSKLCLDSMPGARARLEALIVQQFDEGVDQINLMGQKQFTDFLRSKRPELEKRIKELGTDAKASDVFYKELVAMLEEEFQVNLRSEAAELLGTLKEANASWQALAIGRDLGAEAKLEREVGLLLRRAYLQEKDWALLKQIDKNLNVAPKVKSPPNTAVLAVVRAVDIKEGAFIAAVRELDRDVVKTFKVSGKVKVEAVSKANLAVTDLTAGTRVLLHLSADRQTVEAVTVRTDKMKQKAEK